jgi:hypothetical protein
VEDWAGTITKFKTIINQQETFEDDYIPNDQSLRAQFLKNLCNLATSTNIAKIKCNLQLAAFHLSYLLNIDFDGISNYDVIKRLTNLLSLNETRFCQISLLIHLLF